MNPVPRFDPADPYPDSDGAPLAENTLQSDWIVKIKENLEIFDPAGGPFLSPVELARRARQAEARAAQERARAEQADARAAQERTRAEQADARAEQERARAEQERARADQADARAEQLAARLRALGIDPGAAG